MLYERWSAVAASRRNEIALRDFASGRTWTFGELRAAAEARVGSADAIVFPQGNTPEFVLTLLAAWRGGRIVCPVEAGQSEPAIPTPPVPIIHLKITSATTGPARCIGFTAAQLAADAANIVATMGLRPEWPNLGVLSLAHSYGFSNLVLPLLLHGIPLILAGPPLPEVVRRAAEQESGITLAAVPALWRTWHEAGVIPGNIKRAISAGASLPLGLEQAALDEHGLKIHNFYGSSECGGIAYDASETARTDSAAVGTAMQNVSLNVGDNGCLVVQSQAVGESYWPRGDSALGQGQFQTSDVAELINGTVFLRGRSGDQINVAGRKLDPAAIENALQLHPAVVSCLAFGVPDSADVRGEIIVLCYEAKSKVTTNELRQFLMQRIPAWQLPREWCAVESLSPNQRGKLSRAEWRKWFLEQRAGSSTRTEV
jgi:long-chain acyl-CoA synthetase